MTLSSEIAALTGDEDENTLRAIDAAVATLLGWWPKNSIDTASNGYMRILVSEPAGIPYGTVSAPAFTTSLDATLAEIRRLGATTALTLEDRHSLRWKWEIRTSGAKRVSVWGNSASLAALEALVRAVEGQG